MIIDIENNENLNIMLTVCVEDRLSHHPQSRNWVYGVLISTV